MQLVILAAGQGSRLGDDAGGLPKSLVRVGEEIYLSRQLRRFSEYTFSKKIIVGGYACDVMRNFLSSGGHDDVTLIENKNYLKGNLLSLMAAKDSLDEDFLIFNADHYYAESTYRKIFSVQGENVRIFCDCDRVLGDDDMKVESLDESAGSRLVKISKTLTGFNWGYVGVTYIPAKRISAYWSESEKALREEGDNISVERVLGRWADRGEKIYLNDVSGSWWTEIDTPEDLRRAREIIARYELAA